MRSRAAFLLLVVAGLACGKGATTNSLPSWPVSVVTSSGVPGANSSWVESVTLEVTDPDAQAPAQNQLIILQVTAGDLAPLPLMTGANGQATVAWTIQSADHAPGATQTMAFCSPPAGKSFCTTNLNGPNTYSKTF